MDKQVIISIGREFGSGGREIGEKLAADLGLKLYGRNILDAIAGEQNTDVEQLKEFDEKPRNVLFSRTVNGFSNSNEENIAQMQFQFLRDKADSGESFVVIGRCADEILKDKAGLISVFILGDEKAKIERVMAKYKDSEAEARKRMNRHDKNRKHYHNTHSDMKWGDSRGYDLCINSTRLGIAGTIEELKHYIALRTK